MTSEKSRPISSSKRGRDHGEGKYTLSMAITPSRSPGSRFLIRNRRGSLRLPADQGRGPRESRPERREADDIAVPDPSLLDALVEGDRHGGGGGVSVFLDVGEYLLRGYLEGFRHGLGDSQVGLVRNDDRNVRAGDPVRVDGLADHLGEAPHGMGEHVAAVPGSLS